MLTSLLNYYLPKKLIAQKPFSPRDHSRLLVYERKNNRVFQTHFYQLKKYLRPGDVLVFNDTKVFPTRLIMRKPTGGKIEVFLLREIKNGEWECFIGGHLAVFASRPHLILSLKNLKGKIIKKLDESRWLIKFNFKGKKFFNFLNKNGETPVPPYIKKFVRRSLGEDGLRQLYQTVYARQIGSVAAPTAGFHFTKKLIQQLKKQGVQIEYLTLHIGLGTFAPIKTKNLAEHKMHAEWAELNQQTCQWLNQAKKEKRRIIAVGTTVLRTLENAGQTGILKPTNGWINLFIYPPYNFKIVNGLITNFHLPQSTLLALVAAFIGQNKSHSAGIKKIRQLYQLAIKKKYRFYSFGDAMLII